MSNIIEQLHKREEAAKAEARENYWALVEAMAKGASPAISADDCEAVLATAGKTSKDLEADLALARRVIAAKEDVESYPVDAYDRMQKARENHGELLKKQKHLRDVEMPRAERESEALVFRAEREASDRSDALKELAAAEAACEEARTGQPAKAKTHPVPAQSPRPIVTHSGPNYDGWEPPSPYDFDPIQGSDGVIFWRHRRTGEIVRRPRKNAG